MKTSQPNQQLDQEQPQSFQLEAKQDNEFLDQDTKDNNPDLQMLEQRALKYYTDSTESVSNNQNNSNNTAQNVFSINKSSSKQNKGGSPYLSNPLSSQRY